MLALYVQLAVMALVFAVIGIVQYETRNIFWNPKVRVDNAYAPSGWFYRVNSVFYDPSIYGRFLVRRRSSRASSSCCGDAATRSGPSLRRWRSRSPGPGSLPSFSQSSFVALLVGVTLAAVLVWRRQQPVPDRRVLAGRWSSRAFASPQIRHRLEGKGASLSHVTSGRSKLVSNGVKLVVHHPVLGVGVGGFKRAYADAGAPARQGAEGGGVAHDADHGRGRDRRARARCSSLALVVVALATAFRRIGHGFDGHARLAFGLALIAILVHCLFYNALFEDPTFWGLLALVAARRRAPRHRA